LSSEGSHRAALPVKAEP